MFFYKNRAGVKLALKLKLKVYDRRCLMIGFAS
jgi:hypothetical protein